MHGMASTLSVIIPTYNSERYIGDCLASVVLQNDPDIEVIVVDGASSDGTLAEVAKFPDIVKRVISEKDRGQGDAVEKGLRIATGEILHWHASDDIILPRSFKRVRAALRGPKAPKLVISDGLAFGDAALSLTGKCKHISYDVALYHFARFQSDCAYWTSDITGPGLPIDISQPISIDEDFFLRIWAGHAHHWCPTPLGAFRLRGDQLSSVLPKQQLVVDRQRTRDLIHRAAGRSPARIAAGKLFSAPALASAWLLDLQRDAFRYLRNSAESYRTRTALHLALNAFCRAGTFEDKAAAYAVLDRVLFGDTDDATSIFRY